MRLPTVLPPASAGYGARPGAPRPVAARDRVAGVPAALGGAVIVGVVAALGAYDDVPVALATLFGLVLVAPPALAWYRGRLDVFEPVNVVSVLFFQWFVAQVWYVRFVRGVDQLLVSPERWPALTTRTLLIALGGFLAFLVGYYLTRRSVTALVPRLPTPPSRVLSHRMWPIAAALFVVGCLATAYFIGSVGGLGYFLDNLSSHNELKRGRFYLIFITGFTAIAAWSLFAWAASHRYRVRSMPWVMLLVSAAIVQTALLGARGQVLDIVVILAVVHHVMVRPIRPKTFAVIAVVGLLFLGIAGSFRQSTESGRPEFSVTRALQPERFAETVLVYDYSSLDILSALVDRVPTEIGYRWGGTFSQLATQPIPRAVYPSKPPILSTWYNQQLFGEERSGKKATIIGEGYVNAGTGGVLLVTFVFGWLCRLNYAYGQHNRHGVGAVLVFAILYKFLWSLTGGGFSELGSFMLMRLIPTVGVVLLASAPIARSRASVPA